MEEMLMFKDAVLDEVYLSEVLNQRTITLSEEFTRESVRKVIYFMDRIKRLDDKQDLPKDERIITLQFSSYGGCAYSCLALISKIEELKELGYTINSHVLSFAMSAGFFASIVCTNRSIAKYGYLMCHTLASGMAGTIEEMKREMEHSEELWRVIKEITIRYTKISDEQLEEMRNGSNDWYMNSKQALELGCIDYIK